jgi:hypothetical protein
VPANNGGSNRIAQDKSGQAFNQHFASHVLPDLKDLARTLGGQVAEGRSFACALDEVMAEANRRGWWKLTDNGRSYVAHKIIDWLRDATEKACEP